MLIVFGHMKVGCKNTIIPTNDNVSVIAMYAFEGCTGLTNITIPASVEYIDIGVFRGCSNLESVTFSNTENWYIIEDPYISVSLNNPALNAIKLTQDYVNEMWIKNPEGV